MKRLLPLLLLSCALSGVRAEERDSLYRIGEIVVTGARTATDVRHLPMTVSVVERTDIERSLQPSLLPLLTERTPGLFVTARGVMGYGVSDGAAGGIALRGLSGGSGRMMVLIDGHPQYMGLMGHPIADACQSFLAGRVEVLRGPASVFYGSNAMGGVINIVTRRMKEEGVRTDLELGYGSRNTLQSRVTNRVRAGRFTSVASGSYDRTDGHRPDMTFEQYGGHVRLGYELAHAWNIGADADITHFNASQPGPVESPLLDADQRITRGMTSLAVENDYGTTSGALSLFYNWGRHRIDDGHAPTAPPRAYRFNSRDDMAGISWYQSAQLFRGNRLTVGVDWYRFGGEAWNRYVSGDRAGERSDIADVARHEVAGYADIRQHFGDRLTLDVGLRVDRHSHVGTEWVPQAGLSIHLPHALELKLSAAKGFRYPTLREMYMFPPQNPDLRPERMWSYEASLSRRTDSFSWGLNLFYIDGENLIVAVPRQGASPLNINTGAIENAGLEAEASWRLSDAWTLAANYSFLHMEHPVPAAPEHKCWLGGTFSKGRWEASAGLQYIAGLHTSAAAGSDRTEDFALLNASVLFRAARRVALYVRGENLLAQRYEINAGYPMPRATVFGGVKLNF